LRAEANRLTSPISAKITSAVNGPMPGSWVSSLTWGSDRALVDLPVQPTGPLLQRVDQPQVAGGQLPRDGGQLQGREPGPARAAPAAPRAGDDRARRRWRGSGGAAGSAAAPAPPGGAAAPAAGAPAAARSRLPAAGPPAAAGPRSRRRPLPFFSRAEAIALHRDGCTRCGQTRNLPAALASHPVPNPAPDAAGVPGKPPITFKIGSAPLGTFRLASTSPPVSMTATGDRLRCTPIPA